MARYATERLEVEVFQDYPLDIDICGRCYEGLNMVPVGSRGVEAPDGVIVTVGTTVVSVLCPSCADIIIKAAKG